MAAKAGGWPSVRAFWRDFSRPLGALARNTVFRRCYGVSALLVLLGTTLLWAVLGARLQGRNADQLSDPYMFSNWATFHGASFPGSHSFLLKWPIFWLVNVVGVSHHSLLAATVGVVLITVLSLAFVVYKIDRRPLVFGTVCLGLSLALLLIPAQPYAGALLPVNMAMLTTRNIEYAVYLAALVLFARAKHMKSWPFAAGVLLLAVLAASDKLFILLSLGGALLALVAYAGCRAWKFVTFALHWLLGSVAAAIGATGILAAISASHVTHLVGSGSTPYGVVSGAHSLVLGVVYGVLDLFTNAGANPVYDNVELRQLPGSLGHRLLTVDGLLYGVAALSLLYALLLAWRVAWRTPRSKPRATPTVASLLALALVWSTVAAGGVFVASNHYYPVDARYLAIGLFAAVITVSAELRKHRWQHPENLLAVGVVLAVAVVAAAGTSMRVSHGQTAALSSLDSRTNAIAATLEGHKVDTLVGSYWRVLPVKLAMHGTITAMPMSGCTQPDQSLTSSTWQPNLRTHSFAYLLTLSGNVADFPDCSLHSVVATYGRPNAMQVVSGTLTSPKEMLLFYDEGSKPYVPAKESAVPATVLPVTLDSLSNVADCDNPTIFNVVAHQDDDLLFMNPDLQQEIRAGDCVRTAFLTAGNDGQGRLYWLSRQLGSEAAYDAMLGHKYVWVQQTVELAKDEYVTVDSPRGDQNITLLFFNLPDGNLQGQGFPMSNFASLAKLRSGAIPSMQTVDGQSVYTKAQLVAALAQLMQLYRPSEIHTQADVPSSQFPDHSDHIVTGVFTQAAAAIYDQKEFGGAVMTPLKRYIGYPDHAYPANVSAALIQQKEAVFLAYGAFDDGVCHSVAECEATPTYGSYLAREYVEDPNQQ